MFWRQDVFCPFTWEMFKIQTPESLIAPGYSSVVKTRQLINRDFSQGLRNPWVYLNFCQQQFVLQKQKTKSLILLLLKHYCWQITPFGGHKSISFFIQFICKQIILQRKNKIRSVHKFSFIDMNSSVDTRRELKESSEQCITQIQKPSLSELIAPWISSLDNPFIVVPLKDGMKR